LVLISTARGGIARYWSAQFEESFVASQGIRLRLKKIIVIVL
jgi:hypothetical protein